MNWRRWVGGVAVGAVISGPVLLAASMAGATTGTYTDPRPCSASVNQGICISTVTADYGTSSITLTMTVGQATNPNTDPNWVSGPLPPPTYVGWVICLDSTGANCPYLALVGELDGTFSAGVVTYPDTGPNLCTAATPSYDLSANTYSVSFPASCVGNPSQITVGALWHYDNNGTVLTYSSPTDNPCCDATPDVSSSTTTSTSLPTTTTTTTPARVTTTTQVLTQATSATSGSSGGATASSGQLAYTGPGNGLRVTAVFGVGLLVLGLVALGFADAPRRVVRRLSLSHRDGAGRH